MKKSILISYLLLFVISSFAQIDIRVIDINDNKASLFYLSGEKIVFIDSIYSSDKNKFIFDLDSKHFGFYRLSLKNKQWLDFIYDNEDVEIETNVNTILDSLKVIKSESNKIYYKFVKLNKDYKAKTELLQLILACYPKSDEYYQTTKEKLQRVQEDYFDFVNVTA